MASVVQCLELSKSYSAEVLLQQISFAVEDGDRLGLIGPNGAGKSTLMKLMAGLETPDEGEIRLQRDTHVVFTAQQHAYADDEDVRSVLANAWTIALPDYEQVARIDRSLRLLELDGATLIGALSGGWQKRVQLIAALMQEPDLWFLDEPTNHLDLEAVLWLQERLMQFKGTLVVVSHDRYFLNEIANRIIEVNFCYATGILDARGNYDDFLEQRDAYLHAQQQAQQSLDNQHRREQAWLARRPKARTTKSVSRIKRAAEIAEELQTVSQRNQQRKLGDVGFHGSDRKSKDLIVCEELSQAYGEALIFEHADIHLSAQDRLVVLGKNGSGKSTLLDLLAQETTPKSGKIKYAHELRIVRFSQDRSQLDQDATLKQVICPEGDRVFYRERALHINAWLQMFLFRPDQLDQRIRAFSGGEQARILLSRMMLQEADVLILDEPTNDLDIPSIELLEQSLIEFDGAVVLVTHDRYLMEVVGSQFLALQIGQTPRRVGSYRQWEDQQLEQATSSDTDTAAAQTANDAVESLSWDEQKELRGMEKRIQKAEAKLDELGQQLASEELMRDLDAYQSCNDEFQALQSEVEELYTRWQELEERSAN